MAASEHGEHGGGIRSYMKAWLWLMILMSLKVGLVVVAMPQAVKVSSLLVLMGLKVFLIAAYFMHLKFERYTLVYVAVTPLILGLILFFGIAPDFLPYFNR